MIMLHKTPSLQSAAAESPADFDVGCRVMAEPVRGPCNKELQGLLVAENRPWLMTSK